MGTSRWEERLRDGWLPPNSAWPQYKFYLSEEQIRPRLLLNWTGHLEHPYRQNRSSSSSAAGIFPSTSRSSYISSTRSYSASAFAAATLEFASANFPSAGAINFSASSTAVRQCCFSADL